MRGKGMTTKFDIEQARLRNVQLTDLMKPADSISFYRGMKSYELVFQVLADGLAACEEIETLRRQVEGESKPLADHPLLSGPLRDERLKKMIYAFRDAAEGQSNDWQDMPFFWVNVALRELMEFRRNQHNLAREVATLKEALEYYADEKRWPTVAPATITARAALASVEKKEVNAD
jgi:hypothetical protein